MNYMSLKEASEKWGISVRRINLLCSSGRIAGAQKKQNLWLIPSNAEKPTDNRRAKRPLEEPCVLLGNVSYIETHRVQGTCEYDRMICEITRLFLEGKFEESLSRLKIFTQTCTDKQYLLIAYHIYYYNLMLAGDKKTIATTKRAINQLLKDPEVSDLTKAMVQLNNPAAPHPNPVFLETDPHIMEELAPYMSFLALKSILIATLTSPQNDSVIFPDIICQFLRDTPRMDSYIYCNIIISAYFYITGSNLYGQMYLQEAVKVALPLRWYTPFAQYAIALDMNYIDAIDHDAYVQIRNLSEKIIKNRISLNMLPEEMQNHNEDVTEIQVAYQITCKKSISEIAEKLNLSAYKVKKYISKIYDITGFSTKAEIRKHILSHLTL